MDQARAPDELATAGGTRKKNAIERTKEGLTDVIASHHQHNEAYQLGELDRQVDYIIDRLEDEKWE